MAVLGVSHPVDGAVEPTRDGVVVPTPTHTAHGPKDRMELADGSANAGLSLPGAAATRRLRPHADGGALLLRTYAHVMPQAPDQARAAVDAFLRSCEPGVSHQAGS